MMFYTISHVWSGGCGSLTEGMHRTRRHHGNDTSQRRTVGIVLAVLSPTYV